MKNENKQKCDLKQCSLGFQIWILSCCILVNTLLIIFMAASRIIIMLLWPFVRLSLSVEYLNLKLKNLIIEENLKNSPEAENKSNYFLNNSEHNEKALHNAVDNAERINKYEI